MESKKKSSTKKQKESEEVKSTIDVEKLKKKAIVKGHGIDNVQTLEHPGSFSSTTKTLEPTSLRSFIENCQIEVLKLDSEEIVFDLVGVEPPLANALRRIMIAEIPTMAIEKVHMWQNTSIIPDENLAHRIGLVPIKADARKFQYHKKKEDEQNSYSDEDCIQFKLHVVCTKKDPLAPSIINNTVDEEKFYNNSNVLSGQLEWIPLGEQAAQYDKGDLEALFDDILIAKLRPGQEIEMELFCEKGIGKTHAKWSPVSTAYYRLVPDIVIKEKIMNEDAEEVKQLCPMKVFDIEDLGKNKKNLFVKNPRNCTTCRECVRHEKYSQKIEVGKIKDRFEFHVESVGMYKPEDIVREALNVLKEKSVYWINYMEQEQNIEVSQEEDDDEIDINEEEDE